MPPYTFMAKSVNTHIPLCHLNWEHEQTAEADRSARHIS